MKEILEPDAIILSSKLYTVAHYVVYLSSAYFAWGEHYIFDEGPTDSWETTWITCDKIK